MQILIHGALIRHHTRTMCQPPQNQGAITSAVTIPSLAAASLTTLTISTIASDRRPCNQLSRHRCR